MATNAANIRNNKIYTLADLPSLEARHSQRLPSNPSMSAPSNRIVTLGNLPRTADSSDEATQAVKNASITIRDAITSIDSLEARMHKKFDDLEKTLKNSLESQNPSDTFALQRASLSESSRRCNECIDRANENLRQIAAQQNSRVLRERDLVIQRSNAEICNYVLITLLVLAILTVLGLLFG